MKALRRGRDNPAFDDVTNHTHHAQN